MKTVEPPASFLQHVRHMEKVVVYRIDHVNKRKVPVGRVLERRKQERGQNAIQLLRLAMRVFPSSLEDPRQYFLR